MNFKDKNILLVVFTLLIIVGLICFFWYKQIFENKKEPLTEEQRLSILSSTSSELVKNINEKERQDILNKKSTSTKTTTKISDQERLEILNKTN